MDIKLHGEPRDLINKLPEDFRIVHHEFGNTNLTCPGIIFLQSGDGGPCVHWSNPLSNDIIVDFFISKANADDKIDVNLDLEGLKVLLERQGFEKPRSSNLLPHMPILGYSSK